MLLLVASCALVLSCTPSPEAQVRAAIDDAVEAAEAGDLQALMLIVAEDYRDGQGRNRQTVLGILALHVRGGERLYFYSRLRELQVTAPDRAQVMMLLAVARVPLELQMLDTVSADLFRIDLVFSLRSGQWKVAAADWSEADLGDFLTP